MNRGPVSCLVEGCGKAWPRDPVLEVPCPECGAKAGRPCVARRPSGHVHNSEFAGLPAHGHDARDIEADRQGKYGPCPLGGCGAAARAADVGQGNLFALEHT